MANIEERINKDGSLAYRVKIRLKGYPAESATFNRKTDAKKWAQHDFSVISGHLLSGILFLKVYRAEISEAGMAALPIIKYFNAIKNVCFCFLPSIVNLPQ